MVSHRQQMRNERRGQRLPTPAPEPEAPVVEAPEPEPVIVADSPDLQEVDIPTDPTQPPALKPNDRPTTPL